MDSITSADMWQALGTLVLRLLAAVLGACHRLYRFKMDCGPCPQVAWQDKYR